jgi:hypothetical protein
VNSCIRLFLIACLLVATPALADEREAGLVERFDGDPNDYIVERRDGRHEPVQPWLILYELDIVRVKDGKEPVTLELNGKSFIICAPDKSPSDGRKCNATSQYRIPEVKTSPSSNSNIVWAFMSSMAKWLTQRQEEERHPVPSELPRSGGGMMMPLLAQGTAKIVQGTRTFQLQWQGCTPATFNLYRGDQFDDEDDVLLTVNDLTETRVRQENFALYPGKYHVAITCARNKEVFVKEKFAVKRGEELPSVPDFPGLSAELQQVARAAWLASNGDSGWWLEAYLQIADVPATETSARILREALAHGQAPKDVR